MLTGFRRVIRAGLVGFWRNAYVSLASVFVITVALFVIGSTMMLEQLLTTSLNQLQAKVDINVYFVPSASVEQINSLQTELESLPEVAKVTYTSREDALKQYRERNKNDTIALQALDELGENPLGATLAIQAKETSRYDSIAKFLTDKQDSESLKEPLIDDVNYSKNKESIDKLTDIVDAVERAGLITMIVLLVAAAMITFNTIRLAIYTAREEISVMRLVGASNAFIRGPFIIQGVIYGLISGVLALTILYPIVYWLGPRTEKFFEFNLFTYFVADFGHIFLTLIGVGIFLGFISSVLAIARYLKI